MEDVKFDSKISWFVVVVCACMNFLIMIPTKVSGLFFVEILERYKVSRHLAGYPTFTITLMRCSGGPFAGYFAERFGMNRVMILGSILSAVGISACFFAENISVLTVFIGFIHGSGIAFNNSLLAQIVKLHFKKHISLAFGITQAGACVGAFFTPPLLLWVFRNYGTSGGFLIIGGIVLNSLPIVMILNMLSPDSLSSDAMKSKVCIEGHLKTEVIPSVISSEDKDNNTTDNTCGEKYIEVGEINLASGLQSSPKKRSVSALMLNKPHYDPTEIVTNTTDRATRGFLRERNVCSVSVKETGKTGVEFTLDECGIISVFSPKNITEEKENGQTIDKNVNEFQKYFKESPHSDIQTKLMTNSCSEENLQHSVDHTYSMNKFKSIVEISNKDILKNKIKNAKDYDPSKYGDSDTPPCTSVSNASVSRHLELPAKIQLQSKTATGENLNPTIHASSSVCLETMLPSSQEIDHREELKTDKQPKTRATNANKSLTIFLDVTFWIVIITQSLHVFVLIVFWNTMIDFSRDKNIDRSMEVYLLMNLPIAEIFGRLGLGWITDSNYLTRINFSILSFIIMGLSCSLMAWAQEFYIVMTSIFVFGVVSSGLIAVLPMIVFEFFDSTKHTMGQASRYCLFGPLSFLNGPLIGYFRDTVGSYTWLYHTIAMVSVFCGTLSALIPVLARRRDDKKKRKT